MENNQKKPTCSNCIHASRGQKIGKTTHHFCNHEKHKEPIDNGIIDIWDILMYWHNTCDTHELRN
jgi:hypothetical protein